MPKPQAREWRRGRPVGPVEPAHSVFIPYALRTGHNVKRRRTDFGAYETFDEAVEALADAAPRFGSTAEYLFRVEELAVDAGAAGPRVRAGRLHPHADLLPPGVLVARSADLIRFVPSPAFGEWTEWGEAT